MQTNEAPPAPPPPPSAGNEQYDFIFTPGEQPPEKKTLLSGDNPKRNRMLLVGVGAVVFIICASIVFNFISGLGRENTDALVSAAKQQQELIRVASIGVEKSKTQAAKNIAITTKLSMQSEQAEMQAALKAAKLNPRKILVGSQNAKTDAALTNAEQNNRFDEEFLSIMTTSLKSYQETVRTAYNNAVSQKLKTALTTQYKSANALAGVSGGTEQ